MAIDKKMVEEFEKRYMDTIFNKIGEVGSKQSETIGKMTNNATQLGQSQVSIPNTGITLNNKLVELSHVFGEAGISMFAQELEDRNDVSSSFVGDAIIHDLIDKLVLSTERLEEYSKRIEDVSKKKNNQALALQNTSRMKKLFSEIRSVLSSLFVPKKPHDLSLTEEEQKQLDSSLQSYKDIDTEIWNYSLEDNLVQALVKEIAGPQKFGIFNKNHRYSASIVPGLLEERFMPAIKKLGLGHLVPKLQEALVEEYKKDLPNSEIYQIKDENMDLYVPNFSRKSKEPHEFMEELQRMLKETQGIENGKEPKSIKKETSIGGLGVESFEAVDLGVDASARVSATNAIRESLLPQKSKENGQPNNYVEKDSEELIGG